LISAPFNLSENSTGIMAIPSPADVPHIPHGPRRSATRPCPRQRPGFTTRVNHPQPFEGIARIDVIIDQHVPARARKAISRRTVIITTNQPVEE
jgi:hypothetical protein